MLCSKKLSLGNCLTLLIGICLAPRSALAEGSEYIPPLPAVEAPSAEAEFGSFPPQIAALPDITAKLRVARRCSQFMVTRGPISRTFVADPRVIDIVEFSPNEVSFVGLEQGTTTVMLWFTEALEPLILQVEVTPSAGSAKAGAGNRDAANRGARRTDQSSLAAAFGANSGQAPSTRPPSASPSGLVAGLATAERKSATAVAPTPRYDGHTPWHGTEQLSTGGDRGLWIGDRRRAAGHGAERISARGAVPAVFERSRQAPRQAESVR